jgi:hypothetical protein
MTGPVIKLGNPQGKLSEMLGMSLGEGIGNGLNTFFANRSLESVMQDKALEKAPITKKLEAIRSALSPYGEKGQEIFQQRMAIEQQAKIGRSVYDSLIRAGYPDETAKIWQNQMENAPVGGQSDVIRNVNDLIRRSKPGKGLQGENETRAEIRPTIDIPGTDLGPLPLDFPELKEPVAMTPSEVVKQNEYREKINIPRYDEADKTLKALDEEYRMVKHLQELNEMPGALPTGGEKWNVDWDTGELRIKALATPEAQDYVKTIALMARHAKEFFPGRVTNFDLDQFKQGFPTLANSPEGRRLIAKQMALANRIAYLDKETLKAAMDHYGSGADPHLVQKEATKNYRKLKTQLEDQLMKVNGEARLMAAEGGPRSTPEDKIRSAKTVEELFP